MSFNKIFNKILICDGSYMIHRGLHIPEIFNLRNSKGERTGGIFSFLKMLNSEIKICGDYFPIVIFDQGLAKRRVEVDPHYKRADDRAIENNRILTPEEVDDDYVSQYRKQRNKLIELLTYFGIPCLKFVGWEGDDIMYILSNMCTEGLVLTDDRDMLQLLSESCKVRRPMANELWDINSFKLSRNFNDIYDFVIWKAVKGDGSDNIPGCCKGVGESSINDFIKLLYKFKDDCGNWNFLDYPNDEKSMRNLCSSIGIKYKKAYLNLNKDRFLINLELVDLDKVEVDNRIYNSIISTIDNCRSNVDYFKVVSLLSELEIRDFSIDELMQNVSVRYNNLKRG